MLSSSEAHHLLEAVGCAENVIKHCQVVSDMAVNIALSVQARGDPVNVPLVEVGALLHDIGRSRTHGIEHAIEGALIGEELKLDQRIINIIRHHIGGGISSKEAKVLGIPEVDYYPVSIEERIVAHADNLVMGDTRVTLDQCIQRMNERGMGKEAIQRVQILADEFDVY